VSWRLIVNKNPLQSGEVPLNQVSVDSFASRWEARTKAVERAHFERCRKFRQFHLWLGGAAVTASTLFSVLTTLDGTVDGSHPDFKLMVEVFTGVLAICSPVLTSLVSFLRFEERSNQHHNAAARFSALKRRLQVFLWFECTTACNRAEARTILHEVRKEWDALTLEAPALYKHDWSEIHDLDLENAAARQSAAGSYASPDPFGSAHQRTGDASR
jgi:hypothetical protein